MIRDGVNGRLFTMKKSTAGQVAAALWETLGNPDAAAALGETARREAEQKYTWEHIATRLLKFYTHIAGTPAANSPLPDGASIKHLRLPGSVFRRVDRNLHSPNGE